MTPSDSGKPVSSSGPVHPDPLSPSSPPPVLSREGAYPVQTVLPGGAALLDYRTALMGGYGPGYLPVAASGTEGVKPMDPLTLLMALQRRWFLALCLGLLSAGVAAATTWYVWPPSSGYAQTNLFVSAETPYIIDPGRGGSYDFNLYRKTQQVILRNRTVLQAALKRPEVAELNIVKRMGGPDAVGWLEGAVSAEYTSAPEVLTVYLACPIGGPPEDMEETPKVLAGIVAAYLGEFVHIQFNPKVKRLELLQRLQAELNHTLASKHETEVALAQTLGGARDAHLLGIQREFALQRLHSAEQEETGYAQKRRTKEADLQIRTERLKEIDALPIPQDDIENVIQKDPDFQNILKAIAETTERRNGILATTTLGKEDPDYKDAVATLEDLEKQRIQRHDDLVPEATAELRNARQGQLEYEIRSLEDEIFTLKRYEEIVHKMVGVYAEEAREKNESSGELEDVKQEIAAIQAQVAEFGAQIGAIQLELHAADRVTKIDEPVFYPPGRNKKQVMATWGAGVGAFSLILFGVSWWEFRGRRINSLDDIVHGLGMRVVGALPALPDRRSRALPSRDAFYPNYLIESVDTTRTMLMHAARRDNLHSVIVTSARPAEGKTSLSIQLAASLSRAGRKTLFIDGDMRNPAAHQLFNLPLGPGLSELMRGEVEVTAAIQPTSVRNLWLIPAGTWSPQATEALAQEKLRSLLEQLRAEFDFIIVDSSPVLAVVDGLLIGQQVDAAVFSILNDVSHSPSVYAAYQRLESLGIRILGAVINGMATGQFGYKADYGYGRAASNGGADYPVATTGTR